MREPLPALVSRKQRLPNNVLCSAAVRRLCAAGELHVTTTLRNQLPPRPAPLQPHRRLVAPRELLLLLVVAYLLYDYFTKR